MLDVLCFHQWILFNGTNIEILPITCIISKQRLSIIWFTELNHWMYFEITFKYLVGKTCLYDSMICITSEVIVIFNDNTIGINIYSGNPFKLIFKLIDQIFIVQFWTKNFNIKTFILIYNFMEYNITFDSYESHWYMFYFFVVHKSKIHWRIFCWFNDWIDHIIVVCFILKRYCKLVLIVSRIYNKFINIWANHKATFSNELIFAYRIIYRISQPAKPVYFKSTFIPVNPPISHILLYNNIEIIQEFLLWLRLHVIIFLNFVSFIIISN